MILTLLNYVVTSICLVSCIVVARQGGNFCKNVLQETPKVSLQSFGVNQSLTPVNLEHSH